MKNGKIWRLVIATTWIGGLVGSHHLAAQISPKVACLRYAPQVVELTGTLRQVLKYGPPNYGEDTATDAHLQVWMLELQAPISTCPDTANELTRGVTGVREIQLTLDQRQRALYHNLIQLEVRVTGLLTAEVWGEDFTPVQLEVKRIIPTHPSQRKT